MNGQVQGQLQVEANGQSWDQQGIWTSADNVSDSSAAQVGP